MLQRAARVLTSWSTRWVPDAYVIAVLLTVLAFALALACTDAGLFDLVRAWGGGFWELLSFGMQMCLIIVTGYVLAVSPPMTRGLGWLAGRARSPRGAVVMTALLSLGLAWIHWGLSIVGSAVFVRRVARRQPRADYRLLVCCAYLGLGTLWHAGLSASMPLLVATPGHFMERELGVIPVTRTLFHPLNLGLVFATVTVLTALAARLQPAAGGAPMVDWSQVPEDGGDEEPLALPGARPEEPTGAPHREPAAPGELPATALGARSGTALGARPGTALGERSGTAPGAHSGTAPGAHSGTPLGTAPVAAGAAAMRSPAKWLENSRAVNLLVGGAGAVWLGWWFADKGLQGINLNTVNFAFLMLGVLLHGRPARLLAAAEQGGRYVWGIILQFPFYAGIFGVIKESKLQDVIAGWFVSLSHVHSYPLFVLWYSGLLNYVIPSGGSKWAIEAPYVVKAAHALGANMDLTVLAYAWGDMLTDIIQPFWAIPLLAIARLSFRDIMGYGVLFFLVYAVVVTAGFALVALV